MPYQISASRTLAKTRLKALRSSFVYAKVRTQVLPTFVRDSIFQNCVFQLSATLEDYVSDLIDRWFATLISSNGQNSLIPLPTRSLFAAKTHEESFRRYIGLGNESELASKFASDISVFSLLEDNGTIPSADFHAKLVKDKKFPSYYNLDVVFRRVGLPKIFPALSKRTQSNVELGLRGFMDVRNALAHEAPPSITDEDVARYFDQISRWIEAIDREFYGHVCRVSGQQFWT